MTKYFPQLYDRLVAASTGGGAAVSDELADTPTSRYLLANTGGVEHPSNCPAQCVKVRAAGRWVSVSGGNWEVITNFYPNFPPAMMEVLGYSGTLSGEHFQTYQNNERSHCSGSPLRHP